MSGAVRRTVRQTDTGFTRTLVTSGDGRYAPRHRSPSALTRSLPRTTAFQPQQQTGIVLVIGQRAYR